MLKSTYKPPAALAPLPGGWTQHSAPDGRPYYFNQTTEQSTYIRPVHSTQQAAPPIHEAFGGASEQHHNAYITVDPHLTSHNNHRFSHDSRYRGRGNGRGDHGSHQRPQPKDRPKRKNSIPGCPSWLLVHTKLGRRFVYNTESEESFWKLPPDVMKAVVEYDRLERETRHSTLIGQGGDRDTAQPIAPEAQITATEDQIPTASEAPETSLIEPIQGLVDSDGEEYEEVEVTDDEVEDQQSKRQKADENDVPQPVEFNEDDIAYQLAAMGEDYGLDAGEFGTGEGEELEEGAEGLGLTEEDSKALFTDMLNDYQISPYTTWDKIIEAGHIIEDDRYTVLPNMRSRKEVWDEWSRDTIQRLKDQREKEEKKDPRVPYFAFLQSHATPKLYWPEFRRKYKKEPEMHNTKLSDKDREKWYRDYINRLKLPESTLKADLVNLLKSTPLHILNHCTTTDSLPPDLLTDLRYISLRNTIRDPLISAHISTLPPAPANLVSEEADDQARQERERRERALADRQAQVQEERRRQRGALQHSKGMLREGEEEVQRAMRVGKEGLLGYMEGVDSSQQ